IAIGMICEAWLSARMGMLDREVSDRIEQHLLGLYRPFIMQGQEAHRIIELMRNDKKNSSGQFRFTLLTGLGSARIDVAVTAAQVRDALDHYRLLVSA
ncbi:MAG TPA: 3-dehydroquinate synthase, partial [Flavobacteriales bacterium]|nr:3-dehydroquinate synthase [Flavobacteriales bacterium]